MTAPNPQPGDWVRLHAKVVDLSPNGRDVIVELLSKIGPYATPVRRDVVVEIVPKPIPEEPDPGSVALVLGLAWQRVGAEWVCARSVVLSPTTPKRWTELHELGDVEVIHDA